MKVFEQNQLQGQVMVLLQEYRDSVNISYVFFGVHIFLLGYLILKSDFAPRILGILLIIASLGYLINSFGNFVSSEYASNKMLFFITIAIPAMIAELSLTIWLFAKGAKQKK